MPDNIKETLRQRGIKQDDAASLEAVLPDTDVLYVTRIQRERFKSNEEYEQVCFNFQVQ